MLGVVLGMLKPMMPKFETWLNSYELEEGEVSSSILINTITNDQGDPEIRIDVVSMKVVNEKLTVSRVLQTISQKELLKS